MNLYNKYILPKAINWACGQKPSMKQRKKIIPLAKGNVLEIGVGSGLNLPFYSENIEKLTAIDPSKELWLKNIVNTKKLPFDFEFIVTEAENLTLPTASFDTIVITYTLCTITNLHTNIKTLFSSGL